MEIRNIWEMALISLPDLGVDQWDENWLNHYKLFGHRCVTYSPCLSFPLLQNADNSDYFAYGTQYMLIITTLCFYTSQGNYHILPKILLFSLIIPSFFSSPFYEPFTTWISFSDYIINIFYKYSFKNLVPTTEHSVLHGIWPCPSALGQLLSLIYIQLMILQ